MVTLAEVLADLTNFKIISSTDALKLVSTESEGGPTAAPRSKELERATEFMSLQSEHGEVDSLAEKRKAVEAIADRLGGRYEQ